MDEPSHDLHPKVHPASREILPEDPLHLHGFEVPGDPNVMLRLLVEEYARLGFGLDELTALARDPFYQAFHGLWKMLGEEEFRTRIMSILARCGVTRARTVIVKPVPEQVVQIQIGTVTSGAGNAGGSNHV